LPAPKTISSGCGEFDLSRTAGGVGENDIGVKARVRDVRTCRSRFDPRVTNAPTPCGAQARRRDGFAEHKAGGVVLLLHQFEASHAGLFELFSARWLL
jgi:hypothetical protein